MGNQYWYAKEQLTKRSRISFLAENLLELMESILQIVTSGKTMNFVKKLIT